MVVFSVIYNVMTVILAHVLRDIRAWSVRKLVTCLFLSTGAEKWQL